MSSKPFRHRRRNKSQALSVFLILLALTVGAAGMSVWYLIGSRSLSWPGGSSSTSPTVPPDVASSRSDTAAIELDEPDASEPLDPIPDPELPAPPPLPSLDESDGPWRSAMSPHASHPLALRVLSQSDLIRTFVTSTLEIAEGRSPSERFGFLTPKQPFSVTGDVLYSRIDPASYARYDALVDAFVQLEAESLMRLYARFEPLFDEAYAELGYPGEDFDEQIELAIDMLLRTPNPPRPPALIPRAKTYAYEDPALEQLYPAQRQLLRMGPRNVERIQQRLRELLAMIQAR